VLWGKGGATGVAAGACWAAVCPLSLSLSLSLSWLPFAAPVHSLKCCALHTHAHTHAHTHTHTHTHTLRTAAAALAARDIAGVREAGAREDIARLLERRRTEIAGAQAAEAGAVGAVRARLGALCATREAEAAEARSAAAAAQAARERAEREARSAASEAARVAAHAEEEAARCVDSPPLPLKHFLRSGAAFCQRTASATPSTLSSPHPPRSHATPAHTPFFPLLLLLHNTRTHTHTHLLLTELLPQLLRCWRACVRQRRSATLQCARGAQPAWRQLALWRRPRGGGGSCWSAPWLQRLRWRG
jgi:hypothetical protein